VAEGRLNALPAQWSRRRYDLLAGTGVDRQHEHKTDGAARSIGCRGGCARELYADAHGRFHVSRSAV